MTYFPLALPGQLPSEGPKPSKMAVLLFYLSVVFTILGILIVIRSAFYVEVRMGPFFSLGHKFAKVVHFFVYSNNFPLHVNTPFDGCTYIRRQISCFACSKLIWINKKTTDYHLGLVKLSTAD